MTYPYRQTSTLTFCSPMTAPFSSSVRRLCVSYQHCRRYVSMTQHVRHRTKSSRSYSTDSSSSSAPAKRCRLFDLRGTHISYIDGWDLQHRLFEELKDDETASDAVILVEHRPVYTLGTGSQLEHILFPLDKKDIPRRADVANRRTRSSSSGMDIEVFRTERGGEVTYHGPGQLVMYPIINLRRHKTDLHWYIRNLEQVVIDMLQDKYGLPSAGRKEGLTGVWVNDQKVCAIGLKVSKWITMHGLALNVAMSDDDMEPFSRIIPCGIHQFEVNSLHRIVDKTEAQNVSIQRTGNLLVDEFNNVFGPYEFELVSEDIKSLLSDERVHSTSKTSPSCAQLENPVAASASASSFSK